MAAVAFAARDGVGDVEAGGVNGVIVFSAVNAWPSATSSVWLAVTRCWLLSLVFHSARKAGVV